MSGFNKVINSYKEAMDGLVDGMTIISGGSVSYTHLRAHET